MAKKPNPFLKFIANKTAQPPPKTAAKKKK